MRILCVEDGSVDIDALENGELRDGKVLVYRQGSKPPFVLEIPEQNNIQIKRWNELKKCLEERRFLTVKPQVILATMEDIEEEEKCEN